MELSDGFVKGRISIVMPAFNEAHCISNSIMAVEQQFRRFSSDYEIIVVDDGSTDGTRRAAQEMEDWRVKVVGYQTNQGKGHALKSGFQRATGEYTFMLDSDAEIQAVDLLGYLNALRFSDIIIGSKRHALSKVETPFIRRFLSLGFNVLERLLTGVRATDTQAGIKVARSVALYRILPLMTVKKFAFDAELLTVATLLRFRIKEMPVEIKLSALFSVRQVFRMLIDLLGIAYRLRIKRWYQENLVRSSNTYRPLIPW